MRSTASQVGLDSAKRAVNVRGAFEVVPSALMEVSGRRIILVDDVLTTGATGNACAEALLRAGASSVDVLVFALAVTPSQSHI